MVSIPIVTTAHCLVADVQPRRGRSRSAPGRQFRSGSNLLLSWGFLLAFTVSTAACVQNPSTALSEFGVDEKARERFSLPERLREISGLAMTADDRALAHDDEVGIIYEIDHRHGRVVKAFRLGNDTVRADFEGIAVAGDRIYLVTSDGTIYESPEGRNGERVRYVVHETGVGRECEVEGLAFEPGDRVLLLPCKEARIAALEDMVVIFRWSLARQGLAEPSRITFPRHRLTARINGKPFRPSAIERHPVRGTYFVISAREQAIAEITPTGEILAIGELRKGRHRQPEGIAFTSDLSLVIADEGKRRGQLTLYRRSLPPK